MSFLRLENLEVSYGAIKALKGINLEVEKGEIVTLIGSNGAGKTTTMNTIAGLIKPRSGKIFLDGTDITNYSAPQIVRLGLSLSPEGRQVFPKLSVLDNLDMGAFIRTKQEKNEMLEVVFELFPKLKDRKGQVAGTLSGGEQQMLAVGRAMMAKPRLMMLDEPSLGLAPLIVKEIFDLVKKINKMGTTILLVEQNAKMSLGISNRGYVLETGNIVLEDDAKKLLDNPKVKEAYLGG